MISQIRDPRAVGTHACEVVAEARSVGDVVEVGGTTGSRRARAVDVEQQQLVALVAAAVDRDDRVACARDVRRGADRVVEGGQLVQLAGALALEELHRAGAVAPNEEPVRARGVPIDVDEQRHGRREQLSKHVYRRTVAARPARRKPGVG